MRIQTWGEYSPRCPQDQYADGDTADGVSVYEVLRKGLEDLADLCDVVEDKFIAARDDFDASQPNGEAS